MAALFPTHIYYHSLRAPISQKCTHLRILHHFQFIFAATVILALLGVVQASVPYYTSPSATLQDLTLCTNPATPCNISHLLAQDTPQMHIILLNEPDVPYSEPQVTSIKNLTLQGESYENPAVLDPTFSLFSINTINAQIMHLHFHRGIQNGPSITATFAFSHGPLVADNPTSLFRNIRIDALDSPHQQGAFIWSGAVFMRSFTLEDVYARYGNVSTAPALPAFELQRAFIKFSHPVADFRNVLFRNVHVEGLSAPFIMVMDPTLSERNNNIINFVMDNVTLVGPGHTGIIQLNLRKLESVTVRNSHISNVHSAFFLHCKEIGNIRSENSIYETSTFGWRLILDRCFGDFIFSKSIFRGMMKGVWITFNEIATATVGHFNAVLANVEFDQPGFRSEERSFVLHYYSKIFRSIILANSVYSNSPFEIQSPDVHLEMENSYFYNYHLDVPMVLLNADNGEAYVRDCSFSNVSRSVRLAISPQFFSHATVERCNFYNNYFEYLTGTDAPLFFDYQMGGSVFASANTVRILDNTFMNNTFISQDFEQSGLRNARLGIVAVWMDFPINLLVSGNYFEGNRADVGSGVLLWTDVIHSELPISIHNNTFVGNVAEIGSAFCIFNNLILTGVSITHNVFLRNTALTNGVVYIRSFVQTDRAQITHNIFKDNYSSSSVSHVVDFSFGAITNVLIDSNVFDGNHMNSEIHGTLTTFEGHINNTIFNNSRTAFGGHAQHISLAVETIHNLYVTNVLMQDDSKELLQLHSGSDCDNIQVQHVKVEKRSNPLEPVFASISCGDLSRILVSNVEAFGRVTVEQTGSALEKPSHGLHTPSTVTIENVQLFGGEGVSNLLRFGYLDQVIVRNCWLGQVKSTKGSMLFSINSNVLLEESHIESGYSTTGGCIYAREGSLIVDSSTLTNCHAESGGGIFVELLSHFQMNNSRISKSSTATNGGSMMVRNTQNVILESSEFSSSSASQEGGCVFLSSFDKLYLNNLTFTECTSLTVGGGLLIDSTNASVSSVQCGTLAFHSCKATHSGGGIYVENYFDAFRNALDENRITCPNCEAAYQNMLGSAPTEIVLNDEKTITNAPHWFVNWNPNQNTLYAVVHVATAYGKLMRVEGSMKITKIGTSTVRAPFCPNGPRLDKWEYCFAYEYNYWRPGVTSEDQVYRISFDPRFRLHHRELQKIVNVHIPSFWWSFAVWGAMGLSILGGVVCVLFVVCLISATTIGVPLMFILAKTKEKADTADMELSLLRYRFDQEQLLDADGNRAKLKLNQELFEIKFSDVKLLEKIGSGGSGAVVMRGIWRGEQIALKIFKTSYMTDDVFLQDFENEANLLASLHHPNIVRFYGALLDHPRVGIITEYHPSSVSKLIRSGKSKELTWVEKMTLLHETVTAMEYLVSCKVIHRDLKWENVLLSESGKARLTDLGLSRIMNDANSRGLTARVGTSYLIAPEVVKGLDYDFKCDVFSLGMMMWELLTDTMEPFGNTAGIEFKIATDPAMRPDLHNIQISSDKAWYVILMRRCWHHDPEKRPSFSEIREMLEEEIGAEIEGKELNMHCTFDGQIIIGKEAVREHIQATPAKDESFLMGRIGEEEDEIQLDDDDLVDF